uniref:Uncharacterized protein n=1 Tax=Cacopsylla melanoneura TaxID=428564 RepID=A0A8D8TB07_9HEMI
MTMMMNPPGNSSNECTGHASISTPHLTLFSMKGSGSEGRCLRRSLAKLEKNWNLIQTEASHCQLDSKSCSHFIGWEMELSFMSLQMRMVWGSQQWSEQGER